MLPRWSQPSFSTFRIPATAFWLTFPLSPLFPRSTPPPPPPRQSEWSVRIEVRCQSSAQNPPSVSHPSQSKSKVLTLCREYANCPPCSRFLSATIPALPAQCCLLLLTWGQVSASGLSLSSACDVPPWNIHLLTNFLQIFTQTNPFLCLPYIKSYPYSPSPLFLSLFFTLVLVSPDPLYILLIFLV